jgi:hypothetical protein
MPRLLEKSFCSVRHNSWMRRLWHLAADNRDPVVEAERDAQTIKAGTEIGSARGNTNGDLLHSYAAATRPLTHWPEGDRGSVAMVDLPATHPLRHTDFELSRWSTKINEYGMD